MQDCDQVWDPIGEAKAKISFSRAAYTATAVVCQRLSGLRPNAPITVSALLFSKAKAFAAT
jgi:hypothetical protein